MVLVARLLKIKEWIDTHDPGSTIIPFSGELELKLLDLGDDERDAYCREHGINRWVPRSCTGAVP